MLIESGNNDKWKEVKTLLLDVLAVDRPSRASYLRKQKISREVRDEVESLLACEDEAAALLQTGAIGLSKELFASDAERTSSDDQSEYWRVQGRFRTRHRWVPSIWPNGVMANSIKLSRAQKTSDDARADKLDSDTITQLEDLIDRLMQMKDRSHQPRMDFSLPSNLYA